MIAIDNGIARYQKGYEKSEIIRWVVVNTLCSLLSNNTLCVLILCSFWINKNENVAMWCLSNANTAGK